MLATSTCILQLKNPYMGYAKFRAAFVGDATSEWSVSQSDGFLKQKEATHFVVKYTPHSPGVSNAYFVIETEEVCQRNYIMVSNFILLRSCLTHSLTVLVLFHHRALSRLGKLLAAPGSMSFELHRCQFPSRF